MKLFLASGNPHKARELQGLADRTGGGIEIVSAREVGGMPAVAEDTGTFRGNAQKKARALCSRLPPGAWALADDSGLCVAALHGAPGVDSAYYAGPQGDPAANLAKLIREMRSVPEPERAAYFVCVLFLAGPAGRKPSRAGARAACWRNPGAPPASATTRSSSPPAGSTPSPSWANSKRAPSATAPWLGKNWTRGWPLTPSHDASV